VGWLGKLKKLKIRVERGVSSWRVVSLVTVRSVTISLLTMVAVALAGCSPLASLIPQQVPDEVVTAKYRDIPVDKAYADAQREFNKARETALHFFSPNNYRTARSAMRRARANMRDPEKKTDVLRSLYKMENALNDGFEVKAIVEREMPELIEMRIIIDNLNAKRAFPTEYRSRNTSMVMLIERIEQNKESLFQDSDKKADFVKDKNNMLADLREFQLRVVKSQYLRRGEGVFAEAEKYDAKNNAPKTYSETIKAADDAIAYIEKNLQDVDGIKSIAEQFEFAAFRLLHVTRGVNAILQIEQNKHEEFVLRDEQKFEKISKALKLGDIRNKSQSAQATIIAVSANKLIRQKEALALQIAEIRNAQTVVASDLTGEAPDEGLDSDETVLAVSEKSSLQEASSPEPSLPQNETKLKQQVDRLTSKNKALTEQKTVLEQKLSALQAKLNAMPYVKERQPTPTQVK